MKYEKKKKMEIRRKIHEQRIWEKFSVVSWIEFRHQLLLYTFEITYIKIPSLYQSEQKKNNHCILITGLVAVGEQNNSDISD